ncbi:hypothetical protein PB01_08160 [Psychrobacillus glaciei]|uniref:Uncharacterized protein n=1 Tax=Psychrobacillus glaciei TaxID=2283160 RepID=A0A5J6SLR0_9BACI|nr:peptidoglycan DD-metalloendopeptidase family protein [Psychrobacillus glaciei]QFF98808.1 hypothetical protein PB01_08160 [Psychrobacillus glaciei]
MDWGNTPSNNNIIASADGAVTYVGIMGGYGNIVMIVHTVAGVVYETVYAHLASIAVKVGQVVKQVEKIGVKGTTGNSTGVHLHFEIHIGGRRNSDYTFAKDPVRYVCDPEVKTLQELLNKIDYKLVVDGIEGNATTNAVKEFQKVNCLTVDGIAGSATLSALNKAIALKKEEVKVPSTSEKYRLQTGTFNSKVEAEKAAEELKGKYGWIIYIKEA